MGLCADRRTHIVFLTITLLQIILTIARWVLDFLGPLWSMILTDFVNIVISILGFSGGYAKIRNYLFVYIIWSLLWIGWNALIICLYIPIHSLEMYKSLVLSLGTGDIIAGGLSYWEIHAPGCEPDWASQSKLVVTNCMFDPRLMEFIQAGLQVCLSVTGVISAFILLFRHDFDDNKSSKNSTGGSKTNVTQNTVPAFLSTGRSTMNSRMSARHRPQLGLPAGATNGDSSDQVTGNDDRLRPMTPRRVKRRSARSIQSQKFGSSQDRRGQNHTEYDNERPSTSRGASSNNSARSSLRSNASRRSHRNAKKKHNHQFISPVNRLMHLQQVDSETSHEEPGRYTYRDQGHVNPVYVGPQSPSNPPPPPRPPSARSSYSNYHPARLPSAAAASNTHPNVFNLNQNIFTNGAFDMATEYNGSQHSNATSANLYEEDVNFFPDPTAAVIQPGLGTMNSTTTTMALHSPPVANKVPNGFSFSFNPHPNNNTKINNNNNNNHHHHLQQPRTDNPTVSNNQHQPFAYPLAHSPVSQESFPMWGVSQPQSPVQNHISRVPMQSPPYQNPPPPSFQPRHYPRQLQAHPTNSETVI